MEVSGNNNKIFFMTCQLDKGPYMVPWEEKKGKKSLSRALVRTMDDALLMGASISLSFLGKVH